MGGKDGHQKKEGTQQCTRKGGTCEKFRPPRALVIMYKIEQRNDLSNEILPTYQTKLFKEN